MQLGIPPQLAYAYLQQESSLGTNKAAGTNIGQITFGTAQKPGYGMAPISADDLKDPEKNIAFSLQYLKRVGEANGVTNWNDPAQWGLALRGYNGTGDPNYVQNVARYLPKGVTVHDPGLGQGRTQVAAAPATAPPAAPGGAPARFPPGTVQAAGPAAGSAVAAPAAPITPTPPVVPQTPPNQLAQGQPGGQPAPPTAVPPGMPQPPVMQPPAGGPQAPPTIPLNARGLTAQQQQGIDALASTGRLSLQDRIKLEQQYQSFNIQQAQKQFSDFIELQKLAVSQGNLSNAQFEANLKAWQAAHPELAPNARVATLAYRTMQDLAPAIQSGNATDAQQKQYANAATEYQEFKEVTDPVTKQLKSVPTKPLPPGYPTTVGGTDLTQSRTLTPGLSPAQQRIEQDPAAYKVNESRYDAAKPWISEINQEVPALQQDNSRIAQMQDLLNRVTTGPGAASWASIKASMQTFAPEWLSGWERESHELTGAAAIEALQKLAFQGSISQEAKGSPRGGYGITKLYQELNPGVDMLNAANKEVLDGKLIINQMGIDHGQAAAQHFTTQEDRFADTGKFESKDQFEQRWNSQRNAQVGAAALGALQGQSADKWSANLTPAEYDRALSIAARAKPGAEVYNRDGVKITLDPNQQQAPASASVPAIGTVKGGYRFTGGNPADPKSWTAVQ